MARTAQVKRITNETSIFVSVNLEGSGSYDVSTGIGLLDHMLEQLSCHSLIDLIVNGYGDLHVDDHHTIEDSGYAIGSAVAQALGERHGITRYGYCVLPMDDALTRVAIDLSGRPFLSWSVRFPTQKIGALDTEMFKEWFRAFTQNVGASLHIDNLKGENSHHIMETCFKGLAYAIRAAVEIDLRKSNSVPSTKGSLQIG
ncbi:imidazoleglycerol-phosphate dehydratase family protein [Candidatus Endolissoclinum faulkneri L2]|uniref:Imidazoleglycerol-phosphate dehydratase n=1 Tax=Candidatus Endolissoclinum faulkneri L2 TaxID=1193729 RepID=K7ZC28_9PROT|nr:imidazoleglycerol-phosphate dehydratase HisB [Candidatus Endolissoclinum faulkneri]AFX98241.1 imidazoleglycerol-phosphate dehydratase family protein [Candidatus Endolissoclinum faulkneri L2]